MYYSTDILVLPDEVQAFAWSAPMRDLAAKVGLSDVGLRKLLVAHGVVPPPQGYWNKLRAGKPVPKCPKVPSRRAGESGRVRLDARLAAVLTPAAPLPSAGPFASPLVPEDLDKLHAQELKAIGRVAVPKTLDRVHRGLAQILKQEQRRREKVAQHQWHWDTPKFDAPIDKRRLRILHAIFMALSKRGYDGEAYETDGELHAKAIIGDMHVGLEVVPASKHRKLGRQGSAQLEAVLPAWTPLVVRVAPGFDRQVGAEWQDDSKGTLETKIGAIAAGIIVAGEATFRRSLREAEERAAQLRILEEKRREEELAARNRQRLEDLRRSGELLRQAEEIRALVTRIREATSNGSTDVAPEILEAWESWALAEADRLDPVRSGQIFTHLAGKSGEGNT